jgi:NTP pyrophosphatase (non-canonical NTP hydrolase)
MSSMEKINKFRDERNWRKFHNEKDLAISISLESSELLELFQWKSSDEVKKNNMNGIEEELADVLIYSYMMVDNLNLNVDEIISKKLKKNSEKYPINLSRGNNKKYNQF